ncbi:RDD family protein [Actinomadura meyerae]|uniref:RDD family protein n=1 Tax=Actinomadura meyerae TaxID=240840 RepID=A0A239MUY6_9ACTN|nr:RDD family protein [Actinomadura meyerae]SNT46320.1 RDD family protein [Actinomadura meyerae]
MAVSLADPGQRLLARVVDTLIVGVPVIVIVRELVSGHTVDVVAPPAVAGCMLLYEAVQLALWGRTLGKRFAGIEVVTAVGSASAGRASFLPASVPGFVPTAEPEEGAARTDASAAPSPDSASEDAPEATGGRTGAESAAEAVEAGARPGVLQCLLRAAVYSLPIAMRPIPVAGVLASVFWVVNAGVIFEGTRRQAVHDRVAGTLVVKRGAPDSGAF